MPLSVTEPISKSPVWRWRILAAVMICAAAVLHIAYLGLNCPLDLAPDEAHYWDWSRHLDWSYYSKGPLVAYLIRAGCFLAGSWSQQLTASEMLAVRLPAVACGALLLVSLYILTVQIFGRESLACGVVALLLTSPLIAVGSSLMTIDSPYTCCWGWALVLGHMAFIRGSPWAYPVLGLVVGLGILAKYTMVLFIPSASLFLLASPMHRALLWRRGFWVMSAVAALCCLPILLWNMQHDWVSLLHVRGQAGLRQDGGVRWTGPLIYLGTQAALLLGFWFMAWACAMIAFRPWKATDPGTRYLWWLSAPMFAFFLLFSLKTSEEPNWPVTAYLSGLVLTVPWIIEQARSHRRLYRYATVACLASACGLGLGGSLLLHHSDWFQPVLIAIVGPPTQTRPLPLRRLDPTCRLRGWRFFAAEVDRLRLEVEAEGTEPVIAAASWTLPGELAFYCRGNPVVYSVGLILGDRHSQYDLWRPNPVEDSALFVGRTFVFVGDLHPTIAAAFASVGTPQSVVYEERGQPIARLTLTVCRGFRGFQDQEPGHAARAY